MSQLGDGSTHDSEGGDFEDPAITGAVAVAGGTLHSVALEADGTVWAWGWNGFANSGTEPRRTGAHRCRSPA